MHKGSFYTLAGAGALLLALAVGAGARLSTASAPAPVASGERMVRAIHVDIEHALDERTLIDSATLIVVGTPTGAVQEVPTSQDGTFAKYLQTVRVQEALRGQAAVSELRVVRAGLSSAAHSQPIVGGEELAGPLGQEQQVLFLQASGEPGVFQVVGHTSGELRLDAQGRTVSSRAEARALTRLTIAELRVKIRDLAGKR